MPLKLALGTAQFGLQYGAFNHAGKVSASEVKSILNFASSKKIEILDTAHAYGDSERVLGECKAGSIFRIVTKIPALGTPANAGLVNHFFDSSLEKLKVSSVYGLLLHGAADLLGPSRKEIWRALENLRDSGRVSRIGFSAYGPEEARRIIEEFPVELMQIPMNVFDRRHLHSGILEICRARGIEIHARSVFLQGFALTSPERLRGHLSSWKDLLKSFRDRCNEAGVSQLQAALAYVLSVPEVDRLVVGVDSLEQLREVIDVAELSSPLIGYEDISCNDMALIDPSKWN